MQNLLEERLRLLRRAQNDPQAMALIALQFLLDTQPQEERAQLFAAIQAAAVPHWFDLRSLAALVGSSEQAVRPAFEKLLTFPMIEPYRSREGAYNVHETTRLALRKALFNDDLGKFRAVSARVIDFLSDARDSNSALESMYHRFVADPEKAAQECESLYREWADSEPMKTKQILHNMLRELESSGLVTGRARAEVVLYIGWVYWEQDEFGMLESLAETALQISRKTSHLTAIGRSLCLLGEAKIARGKFGEGYNLFGDAQAIYDQDLKGRTEPDIQRDRATLCFRRANLLALEGRTDDAISAFSTGLEIVKPLTLIDPNNIGWKVLLANFHIGIGRALTEVGQIDKSLMHLNDAITLSEQAISAKPGIANWEMTLANSYCNMALAYASHSDDYKTFATFEKAKSNCEQSAQRDPANIRLQRVLLQIYAYMGDVLLDRGRKAEAFAAYQSEIELAEYAASLDPSNALRAFDLGTAYSRKCIALEENGETEEAFVVLRRSVNIIEGLVMGDPANARFKLNLAVAYRQIAQIRQRRGNLGNAASHYMKSIKILRVLLSENPKYINAKMALFYSLWAFSAFEFNRRHTIEARNMASEAKEILEQFLALNPQDPRWQGVSRQFDELIRAIPDIEVRNYRLPLKFRVTNSSSRTTNAP